MSEIPKAPQEVHFSNTPRLKSGLERAAARFTGHTTVVGRENFEVLPNDAKVIFLTSHFKVLDVPLIANQVQEKYAVGLPNVSVHWKAFGTPILKKRRGFPFASFRMRGTGDPVMRPLIALLGEENFFPIDYPGYKSATPMLPPSRLNSENFRAILERMDQGMTPVMSVVNPSALGELPEKPGIGGVLLAQKTGAVVVPAAVTFHNDNPSIGQAGFLNLVRTALLRPDVTIAFGSPISLSKINTDALTEVLEESKKSHFDRGDRDVAWGEKMKAAREVKTALEGQAGQVLKVILAMDQASKEAYKGKQEIPVDEMSV